MYFKALHNRITIFANVTTLQLIHHLYTTYGCIMPGNLTENYKRIRAPYNPSLPTKNLFDQIEDAVDLAAAANIPYTPSMFVNIV